VPQPVGAFSEGADRPAQKLGTGLSNIARLGGNPCVSSLSYALNLFCISIIGGRSLKLCTRADDEAVNIENIQWFVFVPVSYLLVVAFGCLLEQDPALKMPPGHDIDTDSKCHIFKSVAFS
jgi:hypothetical protein